MQLGQTIKEIRKVNNLTQENFAELFHVTRQTVSNWENEKSYPDLLTLISISDRFNISLDRMLKEDIKMTEKLNKQINWSKRVGIITIIVITTILILMGTWYFIWNHNKSLSENKFQQGLSGYDYSVDETLSKGGYYVIQYDENTYFTLPNQSMPGYFDFSTDFHAKDVDCYIINNDSIIELCWTFYDGQGDAYKNIVINRDDYKSDKLSNSEAKEYAEIIEYGTDLYNKVYR